ncbi:MAG: peptidoglycan editing factor PgeF [Lachnospirales bacterium]
MSVIEKNGVKFIQFDLFNNFNFINHCFSTKIGGVSKNQYSSMNLSYYLGDSKSNVDKNYELIKDAAHFQGAVVNSKQVHGNKVLYVNKDNCYEHEGYDGFVTDKKGITLSTFHADCIPIFLVDPVEKNIGLLHSGWRSTVLNIATEGIKEMINLNSNVENIYAAIGPALNKECFEVDKDVYLAFTKEYFWSKKFIDFNGKKYYIDIKNICREQLILSGINKNNIEMSNHCTKCNDLYYSHRRSGTDRGSMVAFLELK